MGREQMTDVQKAGANAVGHKNFVTATLTALSDMMSGRGLLAPMDVNERLDGKTALVTGANTGLGKAVAIQLAQRGAHVLMACRSGHPDAGEDVIAQSGSSHVEMLKVDLSDLDSASALCDALKERGRPIDIAVFNAGLMPARSRCGPQGFEVMFTVHFLASRLMVERLLRDGVIVPSADPARRPRIVFVSSESHQSSKPIDFAHFGVPVDYGIRDGLAEYGRSKLHLCTYATELAKRLNPGEDVQVSVHSLCPGPVASDIAREAPGWLKPIIGPTLRLLFTSPEKAAAPVLLLAAGTAMEGRNGIYLHMMREKEVSPLAADPDNGRLLWDKSQALMAPWLRASVSTH